MVIGLAMALSLGTQPTVHRVERPLSAVPFGPVGFTCNQSNGFPTLNLDESGDPQSGRLQFWYNQTGNPLVIFVLDRPSGTVVYEYGDDTEAGRYVVRAEGRTLRGNGIANGVPVKLELIVRRRGNQLLTGDFSIEAGEFSRRETDCVSIERPRSLPRTGS